MRNLNNEGKKKESMFVGDTLVEIAKNGFRASFLPNESIEEHLESFKNF